MGRRGELSGVGWKGSEYVGHGGASPMMQNRLGFGAGGNCGEEDRGGGERILQWGQSY